VRTHCGHEDPLIPLCGHSFGADTEANHETQ